MCYTLSSRGRTDIQKFKIIGKYDMFIDYSFIFIMLTVKCIDKYRA